MEHFLWLAREGLEREHCQVWNSLAAECADLEALEVFPALRQAYADGLVDPPVHGTVRARRGGGRTARSVAREDARCGTRRSLMSRRQHAGGVSSGLRLPTKTTSGTTPGKMKTTSSARRTSSGRSRIAHRQKSGAMRRVRAAAARNTRSAAGSRRRRAVRVMSRVVTFANASRSANNSLMDAAAVARRARMNVRVYSSLAADQGDARFWAALAVDETALECLGS